MPRRLKKKREFDMVQTQKMYFSGSSQSEISEGLSVSQQTVSNDLKELERRWIAESLVGITLAKAKELQRINKGEKEAWAAWERSKLPQDYTRITASGVIRRTEQEDGTFVQDKPATTVKTQRSSVGNPQFLREAREWIKLRMDLLGLASPQGLDVMLRVGALYGDNFINIPDK